MQENVQSSREQGRNTEKCKQGDGSREDLPPWKLSGAWILTLLHRASKEGITKISQNAEACKMEYKEKQMNFITNNYNHTNRSRAEKIQTTANYSSKAKTKNFCVYKHYITVYKYVFMRVQL